MGEEGFGLLGDGDGGENCWLNGGRREGGLRVESVE